MKPTRIQNILYENGTKERNGTKIKFWRMFWVGQGNGERKENDNSYKNKGKKIV